VAVAGYVPLGKLTVLEGDPGLGKSLLTVALAAAVSTGDYSRLPGGVNRPPRDVFFVTYEDGLRDTIRGRVGAAGADLSRVHVIEGVRRDDGGEDLVTFADFTRCRTPVSLDVGQVFHSISDRRFTRRRTAISLIADRW
jgi:hypothetical protein